MFYILLVQDCIEILFFSAIIYAFCVWLKTDKTKNLLPYFLVYCGLVISAWIAQLPIVSSFLFSYTPVALLLFIILHEKILQRNLVTLCSITTQTISEEWLDTVLSSSLALINAEKKFTVIIERENSLDHFLTIPFLINAPIGKGILDVLLSSTSYDQNKMILINANGFLRGINASWSSDQIKTIAPHSILLDKEEALFYTLQTDALIFYAHPISRQFTLIFNGKEIPHLPAHHIKIMIKKQLASTARSQRKGAFYENNSTEKYLSQ